MLSIASAVEIVTATLTLSGIVYGILALLGARSFVRYWRRQPRQTSFSPGISILKSIKGADPMMYAAFASHCTQVYAGEYELLFGVHTLEDPAVAEIARLRIEFPHIPIRLIECTQRLGASGKVSNLVQMLPEARFEHILVNDSDILVSPQYLQRVAAPMADPQVGLVTAPYIGRATGGLWAKLEALGIATDFFAGVLTARKLEGGIRYGLGSTLATTKTALAAAGGLEGLLGALADDYEMGARISAAGYRVELIDEVVETSIPAYTLRAFCDHQLRWARTVRDARPGGYLGLGVTYVLPWALATVIASGGALWSFTLLSLALLVRVSVALSIGVGILRDGQVLRDFLLLPLRDFFGLGFWLWAFAGDTIVWRGERFRLHKGTLKRA